LEYEYAEGRYAVVKKVINDEGQEFAVKKTKRDDMALATVERDALNTLPDLMPECGIFTKNGGPNFKRPDCQWHGPPPFGSVGSDGLIAPEIPGMKAHSAVMDIWLISALLFILLFNAASKLTKEYVK
ncbi:hypothetical protein BGW39_001648, partial [Mortierella sp. 14UC]